MKSWILAARPKTLPAAVVPVWVGSYALLPLDYTLKFSPLLFASTLLSCVCIQIATNLFNDAIDFDKGADTENRLGPVRATATGLLSRRAVFGGALGFCALAAVIALPMIFARGWPIVAIGSVSLLLAYGYTGGPVPLAYKGLGELFVIVFFGLIAVGGSWYVQTGQTPDGLVVLSGLQVGMLSAVLIAVNNLRDVDEDRLSNKRTLAVRFGVGFARVEIAAFALGALLIGFGWCSIGYREAFFYPLFLIPLAAWLVVKIATNPPGRMYNRFLALSAALLLGFGILFTIGMLVFH
jgi:1,4-dihydroxy-2-naphthoate octaprenyltransferase